MLPLCMNDNPILKGWIIMGRLKGLDEMEGTGLEIDWDTIIPDSSSRGGSHAGHGRSKRTTILSVVLASSVFAAGAYVFTQGLLPSGDQIRFEMARREGVLADLHNRAEPSGGAIRPGIDGVQHGQSSADPADSEFYRDRMGVDFPAGRVDADITSNPGIYLMPVAVADMTGNGFNKVMRVRDVGGERIWLTAYIPANGEARFSLPAGGYQVLLAEGAAWHSPEEQFRDKGRYYAPQIIDVRQGQSVRIELPAAGDGPAQARVAKEAF